MVVEVALGDTCDILIADCILNAQQAAHSVMWSQSFMSAQPSPIMQPPRLQVLDSMYYEDAAIKKLMAVLVRRDGENPTERAR